MLTGIETALIVSAIVAAGGWLLRRRTRVATMLDRRRKALVRRFRSYVRRTDRAWLIYQAEERNERVLISVRGQLPRVATWDGACPETEYYFGRNLPVYRQSLAERRTPHRTSRLGNPPRIGTRRPCSC